MTIELGTWPHAFRRWPTRDARDRAFSAWLKREERRVSRQRKHLEALMPAGELRDPELGQLVVAIQRRAEELLDMGHPGAADQLLEFLPARFADAFTARYFGEQNQENETNG